MALDLSFNLPMQEALAFWKDKLQLSPGEFAKLSDAAKTRAFSVSGIAKGDELNTVYTALNKALKEGTSFEQFKKDAADVFERRGWTGQRAWRLDTIFRTNIQTAYNVGRYQQMQQVKDRRPYWRYSAVNDSRTRPAHRAMHGKIFPADHQVWNIWYPPNGFRCFPAGTPVLTPSGWRSIESICLHDAVIGGSGQSHLVTAIHLNSFNGNLVRLSFKGGVIASTPNHRILTMRGWVRADALQTGDVLVQTGKPPSIDTAVGQIDYSQAKSTDGRMSLPVKGETPVAFAFDRQIEGRNENINPFGSAIGVDNMVMQHLQTSAGQVIKHNPLSASGRGKAGGVLGGIAAHYVASDLAHLATNLGTPGGCAVSEFLSGTSGTGVDFLGLSKPGVPPFLVLSQGHLPHEIGGFDLPGLGVDPLHADGLPALAWSHAEMLQQSHQRADIHLPSVTELPIGQQFIKVETAEDLGGGAPFDSFDTLDGFVAWARLHACLHEIEYIDTIPYSGTVFNLTVESDRSYIIPGATVHNCRCSVNSVSAHDLELEGWKVETTDPTGKLYEPTDPNTGVKLPARLLMPDEGWRFNPGKEWQKSLDETLGTKLATLQPDIAEGVFTDLTNRLAVETDKSFSEWAAAVHSRVNPDGKIMTTGERKNVWFIEPDIAAALNEKHGTQLQSSLITITDKKLIHSEHLENLATGTGRKAERIVTPEQAAAMPKLIREAKAVLYDTQNPALLYVFNTDVAGESGKWVVRVDMADKKMKDVTNAVTTGAILPDADILDKIKSGIYSKLKGEV